MYQDSPGWRVLFELLGCLYENSPVKIDIAGTEESIAQITPELLYTCYDVFYNLNNMVLSIAGNFDPDIAIRIIEENLRDTPPVEIERAPYDERPEALKTRAEIQMDVSLPQFYIGFKQRPAEGEAAFLRQQFELEILHELLIGSTSSCYEKLLRQELITSSFGTEVFRRPGLPDLPLRRGLGKPRGGLGRADGGNRQGQAGRDRRGGFPRLQKRDLRPDGPGAPGCRGCRDGFPQRRDVGAGLFRLGADAGGDHPRRRRPEAGDRFRPPDAAAMAVIRPRG